MIVQLNKINSDLIKEANITLMRNPIYTVGKFPRISI